MEDPVHEEEMVTVSIEDGPSTPSRDSSPASLSPMYTPSEEPGQDDLTVENPMLDVCARLPFCTPFVTRYRSSQRVRNLTVVAILIAVVALCGIVLYSTTLFIDGDESMPSNHTPKSDYFYINATNGGIAGDSQLCAEVGRDILEKSAGNAIDAAIATAICAGVAQPFSSGIGGGCVINVYLADEDKAYVIDARETAVKSASQNMFVDHPSNSTYGPSAIATPGEVMGLWTASRMFGKLPWADLVEPSIPVAESTVITPLFLEHLEDVGIDIIKQAPVLAEQYIVDGEFVKEGAILKRPELARTLQRIADDPESFYSGSLAHDIVNEVQQAGGRLTLDDLEEYEIKLRDPLVVPYQYYKLHLAPPPFGGAVLALAMNILEHDELQPDDPASLHLMIEAWKWAYSNRLALGDPDFVENMDQVVKAFVSKDHAAHLRSLISPTGTFPVSYYSDLNDVSNQTKQLEDHGTMHLNAADKWGNMVSLTSTVNLSWGSKFVGPVTGIVYNNEMDDFATPGMSNYFEVPPAEANYIAPGKRPLSSMCPTIVTKNGKSVLTAGASGGTHIITSTMQAILNVLSFGMNAGDAIGRARLHDQLIPDQLWAEDAFSKEIIQKLEKDYGHTPVVYTRVTAVTALIHRLYNTQNSDHFQLASDWRKDGAPSGY